MAAREAASSSGRDHEWTEGRLADPLLSGPLGEREPTTRSTGGILQVPLGVIDMRTDDEGADTEAVLGTIAFTSL
jgi:hypothetical protein